MIFITNHKIISDMIFTHLVKIHSVYDFLLNRHLRWSVQDG